MFSDWSRWRNSFGELETNVERVARSARHVWRFRVTQWRSDSDSTRNVRATYSIVVYRVNPLIQEIIENCHDRARWHLDVCVFGSAS